MNMSYSERAQAWDRFPLLQQATNRLEEILENHAPLVRGEWDVAKDERWGAVGLLKLSDSTGEQVIAQLDPDELENRNLSSYRLYRLWGDLLHAQSVTMLKKLRDESGD